MVIQSVNSTKKVFSKPHLITSPMHIDVQKREAKIYERRDVTPRGRTIDFLANAFGFQMIILWVVSLIVAVVSLIVAIAYWILTYKPAPVVGTSVDWLPFLREIINAVLLVLICLLPNIAGTIWMWIRRDFWAAEMAKTYSKIGQFVRGEYTISLKKIDNTTQTVFINKFISVRWNATGDHANTLQTIDVRPVMMRRKRWLSKGKLKPACWVATLKYSHIPKNGKTDLTWIK
jgi:hypothetical protein